MKLKKTLAMLIAGTSLVLLVPGTASAKATKLGPCKANDHIRVACKVNL